MLCVVDEIREGNMVSSTEGTAERLRRSCNGEERGFGGREKAKPSGGLTSCFSILELSCFCFLFCWQFFFFFGSTKQTMAKEGERMA